ncbi:HK97 family phage prohead protease [Salicibibacter kimchii]|uniref:HK97 family phage prohead protease n=1 Tax=Salicibibacter kimchii TaxID=2099786 RepID=A0A345C2I5_9BACI|nr:HK97 family phage prohead protease [Salicibibacter kimchii]AXF57416.1 HK97 family phage prohead protease [Salicibibacter kimchii]
MKETRTVEIRTAALEQDSNELVVTGTPVVFDTATQINDPMGQYTEIINRGALQGVDLNDTRLLYNHDLSRIPLAKAPKTMQLRIDDKGLHMRATLPDTEEGRSVYTAVSRGDLTGMSFSFTCDPAGSRYDVKTQTRSISRIKKIFECSIVPFPAYQTTSVEARNQMDEAVDHEKARQAAKIKLNQLLVRRV